MIASLLLWSLYFVLTSLYGLSLVFWLQPDSTHPTSQKPGWVVCFLLGLSTVSAYGMLASFWFPLGVLAFSLLLGSGLVLAWSHRGIIQSSLHLPRLHPLTWVLGLVIFLTVLEVSTNIPANPDSGIYHAQAIRWIEQYPVVPGLGNLHTRFAFNSSWLVVNALFSLSFLGIQSFHLLPSLLFLVLAFYLLQGVDQVLIRKHSLASLLKVVLLPLAFYMFGSEISSPGTDLPALILTWFVLLLWLDSTEQPERANLLRAVSFILSVFALTVKLSTLPLLLTGFFWVAQIIRQRSLRSWVWVPALAAGVILPWMARSVITSGYIIYPQTWLDWFSVDWKIPLEVARHEAAVIQAWAQLPREPFEVVSQMTFGEWSSAWFNNLTANQKLTLLAAAFAPLSLTAAGLLSLWKRQLKERVMLLRLPSLVAYLGLIFWFITAPSFRFGYGWLGFNLGLTIVPWISLAWEWISTGKWASRGVVIFLTLFYLLTLLLSFDSHTFLSRIVFPADYRTLPTVPCRFGNFSMLCAAEYDECWYEPFPCVPAPQSDIWMRGDSYADGFWHPAQPPVP